VGKGSPKIKPGQDEKIGRVDRKKGMGLGRTYGCSFNVFIIVLIKN
jgi:hypothetical protein